MDAYNDIQESTRPAAANGLGAHIATFAAVLMLVGIAVAVREWMPAGGHRDMIIAWIIGVAAWSWLLLIMRLSAERTVLLVVLLPTVVILTAMVGLMQLTEADRPEFIQPIAESGGEVDRG